MRLPFARRPVVTWWRRDAAPIAGADAPLAGGYLAGRRRRSGVGELQFRLERGLRIDCVLGPWTRRIALSLDSVHGRAWRTSPTRMRASPRI